MALGPVPLHMISPDNFGGTNNTKILVNSGNGLQKTTGLRAHGVCVAAASIM